MCGTAHGVSGNETFEKVDSLEVEASQDGRGDGNAHNQIQNQIKSKSFIYSENQMSTLIEDRNELVECVESHQKDETNDNSDAAGCNGVGTGMEVGDAEVEVVLGEELISAGDQCAAVPEDAPPLSSEASTGRRFERGQLVWYVNAQGALEEAVVLAVHFDDFQCVLHHSNSPSSCERGVCWLQGKADRRSEIAHQSDAGSACGFNSCWCGAGG